MTHQFSAFIDDLKQTHGDNLASVILYGSAAAGDFVPQKSDYNLLIALHKIAPKDLRNAHACVREWHKMGHPVPVYFTYITAWAEANGRVEFRPDVYGRDGLPRGENMLDPDAPPPPAGLGALAP